MPTSPGHGEKRSRKQDQAIAALLECQTIRQAAERVGVGESTLRGWMKRPEFTEASATGRCSPCCTGPGCGSLRR